MNSILIRPLEVADLDDYRAIRLDALRLEPDSFGSTFAAEADRPIAHFAERLSTSTVIGAYFDGRIVGMAAFKAESGERNRHKGFVWSVYVDRAFRRRGVGRRLMAAVIDHASLAVEQLVLTVADGKSGAVALYRGLGFSVYGREPRALKDRTGYTDELLMIRSVGANDAWVPRDGMSETEHRQSSGA